MGFGGKLTRVCIPALPLGSHMTWYKSPNLSSSSISYFLKRKMGDPGHDVWLVAVVWPLKLPSRGQVSPVTMYYLCTCCEPPAGLQVESLVSVEGLQGDHGAWGKTLVFEEAIARKCPELLMSTKAGSLPPGRPNCGSQMLIWGPLKKNPHH